MENATTTDTAHNAVPFQAREQTAHLSGLAQCGPRKTGEINKAFVMLYLYEKNIGGPLQRRQLVPPWITWVSVKCQLSGLLWKARAKAFPRDNIQYQMSPDIDQHPGVTAKFSILPLPPLIPTPMSFIYHHRFSIRPHWGTILVIPGTPCNTTECHEYRNMLSKCYQMQIFRDISDTERERPHVDMHITNKRPSWTTAEKSQQALQAARLANKSIPLCFCIWSLMELNETPPLGCCYCLARVILPKGHISIHF